MDFRLVPVAIVFLLPGIVEAQAHAAASEAIPGGRTEIYRQPEVQKGADPSFGQRAALAVVGSLVLGLPFGYRDFTEDYELRAAAWSLGAIAGSSIAGIPGDNSNVAGSVAGTLIGAAPLLLDLLEGSTGTTSGIELAVVPIAALTIPLGAAMGGRWIRFGGR